MDKKLKFTDEITKVLPLLQMLNKLEVVEFKMHRFSHAMMLLKLSMGAIPVDPSWIPLPVVGLWVDYLEIGKAPDKI